MNETFSNIEDLNPAVSAGEILTRFTFGRSTREERDLVIQQFEAKSGEIYEQYRRLQNFLENYIDPVFPLRDQK